METTTSPKGGFYMLPEEISWESVTDNEDRSVYGDDDFYPDASF